MQTVPRPSVSHFCRSGLGTGLVPKQMNNQSLEDSIIESVNFKKEILTGLFYVAGDLSMKTFTCIIYAHAYTSQVISHTLVWKFPIIPKNMKPFVFTCVGNSVVK